MTSSSLSICSCFLSSLSSGNTSDRNENSLSSEHPPSENSLHYQALENRDLQGIEKQYQARARKRTFVCAMNKHRWDSNGACRAYGLLHIVSSLNIDFNSVLDMFLYPLKILGRGRLWARPHLTWLEPSWRCRIWRASYSGTCSCKSILLSRDLCGPIRGQYYYHVIFLDQLEASITILYIYRNPLEYSCIPPYILIIPPLEFYDNTIEN